MGGREGGMVGGKRQGKGTEELMGSMCSVSSWAVARLLDCEAGIIVQVHMIRLGVTPELTWREAKDFRF